MRKIPCSLAAFAALTSVGYAADLPARKEAPPVFASAPAFSWTGFYVGLNAGGAWNTSAWSDPAVPPVFASFNTNGSGFLGGGQLGYLYQTGQFVIGAEGQIDFTSMTGTTPSNGLATGPCFSAAGGVRSCNTKQTWVGSLNLRAGIAADRFLIYGTGGVAFTNYAFKFTVVAPATAGSWSGGQRAGWDIGGGVEYALTNNWIIGAEYKYYDFGRANGVCTGTGAIGGCPILGFRETESVLTARVNYKF